MSKTVKKATKSVSKAVKTVTSSVKKIAEGKVSEGLGDLGQGAAQMGLDIATGGNKKVADQLSGGLLTSAELAARGNTEDISRLGITAGATVVGGPAAGMAVNQVYAQGGNALQAGMAGAGSLGYGGIANVAGTAIGGLFGGGSPQPPPGPMSMTSPSYYETSYPGLGSPVKDNTTMYMAIGGGVGLIVLLMVIMKLKKSR